MDLFVLSNYDPINLNRICDCMCFIRRNIDCHFEITNAEKNKLQEYSKLTGINYYALLSFRNTIISYQYANSQNDDSVSAFRIALSRGNFNPYNFYKNNRQSPNTVYKKIKKTEEYKYITQENKNDLLNIIKRINNIKCKISDLSNIFEKQLNNVFDKLSIEYYTERQLRELGKTITPDIVFKKPIFVQIDNKIIELNWLDAKNYMFIGKKSNFIYGSLTKQAKKYNNTYGEGGFVFSLGYATNCYITDTWIFAAESFGIISN
jgi:hypothetical protein